MLSRKPSVMNKLFFVLLIVTTLITFLLIVNRNRHTDTEVGLTTFIETRRNIFMDLKNNDMKYILLWTPQNCSGCAPFNSFTRGQFAFKRINCPIKNCFITTNRTLLGDYTAFDAILFNGRQVITMADKEFPTRRSAKQTYVFIQLESADRFPVCNPKLDNFFNKTFTYRLSSDFPWPYFEVALLNGTVIGPTPKTQWLRFNDMRPASESLRSRLKSKSKTAAWFVSNCVSRSKRERFAKELQSELRRYNVNPVDVYGKCGPLVCPKKSNACASLLRDQYYFYLAFENSFSEDYVTEKLLTAVQNDVVPVVFGAADYNRFLPPGSYLHGRKLGAAKLAATMLDIMGNSTRYEDMFRWKQHYKYTNTWPPPLCGLCQVLHGPSNSFNVHQKFREWWYPNYKKRC